MKKYPKYITIQSTISPEMPEEWTAKKLKYVLSYTKGKQPAQLTEDAVGDPYATMDYLRGRDSVLQYPVTTEGLVHIDDDSLLVLWDGANAGEFLRGKNGYLGSTMASVEPNESTNKNYLFYLLKGSESLSKKIAGGTTIPHFSPTFFDEKVAIPTYEEQKKIVAFLDYKTSKIDRLSKLLTARIDDLKTYRQALISETVIRGLDKSARLRPSGNEWIGEIPESWKVINLSRVCDGMRNGYVGPTRDLFVDAGVKYIQSLHIKDGVIDFLRHEYYVSEDWLKQRPIIREGNLLIVQTGDIGQVAVVTKEFDGCGCHALIIVDLKKDIVSPQYVGYYLRSKVGKELLLNTQTGALLPHLNSGKVGITPIPIPPLHEQQSIVLYLDRKTAQIDDCIAATEKRIEDLQKYRLSLITDAVTGQIDVRDWKEPAE